MKNFTTEAEGAVFNFITMNRRRLQLFQVYVEHEGEKHRCHMQVNEETGDFYITDPAKCPEVFHKAVPILNSAIKIYGKLDKIPV